MIDHIGRETRTEKTAAAAAASAAAHAAAKQVDRGDLASSEEMIARVLTDVADEKERREVLARAKEDPDFRNRLTGAALARSALTAAHADRNGCPTSEELVDYADGQLNDKHSRELAEHERKCVVCRKELRALRRMDEAFQQGDKHENTVGASPKNDESGAMELPDSKGDLLYHERDKRMNCILYKANMAAAQLEPTIGITAQCMAVVRPVYTDTGRKQLRAGNKQVQPGDLLVLTYTIPNSNGQVRVLGYGIVGDGDGTHKTAKAFVKLPTKHDKALENAGYRRDQRLNRFTGICLKSIKFFDLKERPSIPWPCDPGYNAIHMCGTDLEQDIRDLLR
jgi:hypothetical protein